MSGVRHMVVFSVDEQRFALPLEVVERVVRVVEVTPLPDAPADVLGVINVQGRVVPVINLRRRCGLAEREVELDDQLVITRAGSGGVALLVDRADVIGCPAGSTTASEQILAGLHGVREVVRREDGLILIYDPAALLSREAEQALSGMTGGRP